MLYVIVHAIRGSHALSKLRFHLTTESIIKRGHCLDKLRNAFSKSSFYLMLQIINHAIKNKQPVPVNAFGQSKKSLGPRRGGGKFVPPVMSDTGSGYVWWARSQYLVFYKLLRLVSPSLILHIKALDYKLNQKATAIAHQPLASASFYVSLFC